MQYSRKQINVLYRAMKQNEVSIDRETVSYLYDFAGIQAAGTDAQNIVCAVKNAVESIFNGEFKSAQKSIDNIADTATTYGWVY